VGQAAGRGLDTKKAEGEKAEGKIKKLWHRWRHKLLSAHRFLGLEAVLLGRGQCRKARKSRISAKFCGTDFHARGAGAISGLSGWIGCAMAGEDEFEPRLGRMRAKGKGAKARKFMSRVIAAANLARGGAASKSARSKFTGSRIGRGAGAGRVLASRDRHAAFRQRRVIVKARTVSLRGKGLGGAKAHLRYVERDGTTKDGGRGHLYGPDTDKVDRVGVARKGERRSPPVPLHCVGRRWRRL
jgi:hypothetical protein